MRTIVGAESKKARTVAESERHASGIIRNCENHEDYFRLIERRYFACSHVRMPNPHNSMGPGGRMSKCNMEVKSDVVR